MKTPLLIVLTAVVLGVGSTLANMNNACKSSHHTWCAPRSDTQHHVKTLGQLGVPLGSGFAPPATEPERIAANIATPPTWLKGNYRLARLSGLPPKVAAESTKRGMLPRYKRRGTAPRW